MAEVRIANVQLPNKKHIWIALTSIYGVGRTTARKLCEVTGIDPTTKVFDLTEEQQDQLRTEVERYTIEGDLRRETAMNIKRKKDIGHYEGRRHRANLPLRKRTRTNARTRKGPRRQQQVKKAG